uniref:Protein phosphatase 1 regulatory subunit 12B n=1 Tax=Globodera pallida TaxID=36090 RepID=A0A183CBA5_GLOPA
MPLLPFSYQKLYGSRIPTTKSHRGARERRLTIDLGSAMFSSSPASTANLGPSRSQTPTNPLNNVQMNGSFTLTLPRERPSPAPKCFGKSTHMLKEDYERERARWEKKLEEAEQKLSEAAVHNSELFQLKAELNRKIIDFEKSQRPLIEQNRRLNERIKAANGETRKLEEQLAHVQDELLTLKDAYERVQKENASLRELRAFPEKLEELSRYRAQTICFHPLSLVSSVAPMRRSLPSFLPFRFLLLPLLFLIVSNSAAPTIDSDLIPPARFYRTLWSFNPKRSPSIGLSLAEYMAAGNQGQEQFHFIPGSGRRK